MTYLIIFASFAAREVGGQERCIPLNADLYAGTTDPLAQGMWGFALTPGVVDLDVRPAAQEAVQPNRVQSPMHPASPGVVSM